MGEGVVPRMTKPLVPYVSGDRGERLVLGGLGHGVELVARVVTAEDHLPRPSILDRTTKIVKLDVNRIFMGKYLDRDKVFD